MTTIRAQCPDCTKDINLTSEHIVLEVDEAHSRARYGFGCPYCNDYKYKPADQNVITLLISGGCKPYPWGIPDEALEVHEGDPFTLDDVIDLMLALEEM